MLCNLSPGQSSYLLRAFINIKLAIKSGFEVIVDRPTFVLLIKRKEPLSLLVRRAVGS